MYIDRTGSHSLSHVASCQRCTMRPVQFSFGMPCMLFLFLRSFCFVVTSLASNNRGSEGNGRLVGIGRKKSFIGLKREIYHFLLNAGWLFSLSRLSSDSLDASVRWGECRIARCHPFRVVRATTKIKFSIVVLCATPFGLLCYVRVYCIA